MTDRSELAKLVSRSIALTGPIWENLPVNLCPDDDPPGEPRPMKAAPVNNLTPFIDAILESDWLRSVREAAWDEAASAVRFEVRAIPCWVDTDSGRSGFDLGSSGLDPATEEGGRMAVLEALTRVSNPYRSAYAPCVFCGDRVELEEDHVC